MTPSLGEFTPWPTKHKTNKRGGGAELVFGAIDYVNRADRVPLGRSYEKNKMKEEKRERAANSRCIVGALEELELLRTAAIFAVANPPSFFARASMGTRHRQLY